MQNTQYILSEALELFHTNEEGIYIENFFIDFGLSLRVNLDLTQRSNLKKERFFRQLWQDIWNISTLIERIEWIRKEAIENRISENRWRNYTQVDIEHFHTEIRSAMDYVAKIVSMFSDCHGQLPDSFNRLQNRIEKYQHKLNSKIFSLIQEARWFYDIRYVRDFLVHNGADTLVFSSPQDGILFQVYDITEHTNLINNKYILFNDSVVYFDKYASLYFSQLLVLLNNLGQILFEILPSKVKIDRARSYSAGFFVVKEWIEKLYNEITELITEQTGADDRQSAALLGGK